MRDMERWRESIRKWRLANPDKVKAFRKRNRETYYADPEKRSRAYKANCDWKKENRDKVAESSKRWAEKNPDKIRELHSRAYYRNRKKHIEYSTAYSRKRRKEDVQYRLGIYLRNRLNTAIRKNGGSGSAVRSLGCSIPELKEYLEKQFVEGMTWEKWSFRGWHIDHIHPLSRFDLTDPEQVAQACNYKNLQPLWATDNLRKSNKIISKIS